MDRGLASQLFYNSNSTFDVLQPVTLQAKACFDCYNMQKYLSFSPWEICNKTTHYGEIYSLCHVLLTL